MHLRLRRCCLRLSSEYKVRERYHYEIREFGYSARIHRFPRSSIAEIHEAKPPMPRLTRVRMQFQPSAEVSALDVWMVFLSCFLIADYCRAIEIGFIRYGAYFDTAYAFLRSIAAISCAGTMQL